MTEPVEIDFYSDPACGWAWRTSLWIHLVAKQRPVKINWKVFSLGVVNFPEDWKTDTTVSHLRGARMLRTLILAGRVGGNEAVDRLSIAYGNAMPSASNDELIVLAVYMPPHEPLPGIARRSISWKSCSLIRPAVNWPTASKTLTMLRSWPW